MPDNDGGFGLHLVEQMADEWGVAERVIGKTVWATVIDPVSGVECPADGAAGGKG
jgi:hypothetical protein